MSPTELTAIGGLVLAVISVVILPLWFVRRERRRRLYEIAVPVSNGVLVYSDLSIPDRAERRVHRRQRRREAQVGAAPTDRRESVRFWSECQRNGTPTERAIAPQMLALLRESAPLSNSSWRRFDEPV